MKFMVLYGLFSIQFFVSCEFQVKVINLIVKLFLVKKNPCNNCTLSPYYEKKKNSCDGLWVSSVAWKWFPYHPRNLLRMYIDPTTFSF